MIFRLTVIVALWLLSTAAWAQTTTFGQSGYLCADGTGAGGFSISVTGGTTLQSVSVPMFTNAFCMANVGKFGKTNYNSGTGLYYYTFTPTGTVSQQTYGLNTGPSFNAPANGPVPSHNNNTSTNFLGGSWGIGYGNSLYSSGAAGGGYTHQFVVSVPSPASGLTGAVVVNLNTDPWSFWATNDINNLVCNGSGSSGSTHPKWNGDCAHDPSMPGSLEFPIPSYTFDEGGGDDTGQKFYLAGGVAYPAVTLGTGDQTTVSFATNSTLAALLPGGYLPWNDNTGSTCSYPCPSDTVTFNVANAPGWSASATLQTGSRVLAGPGWTPGGPGHFNNGQALYLWARSGTGAGTTAGSASASFSSCGSPANVGGGLDGSIPSAWASATHFTDTSGNTWYCLSKIDYPSLNSVRIDTNKVWSNSTGTCATNDHRAGCYWQLDTVINNGNVYWQPPGGAPFCQSATGSTAGPTGTNPAVPSSDGSCGWWYLGTQLYTPQTYLWPLEQQPPTSATPGGGAGPVEVLYTWAIVLNVFYGGADVPLYQAGVNGEPASGMMVGPHAGFVAEAGVFCPGGFGTTQTVVGFFGNCVALTGAPRMTVPPGDSFVDNMNPATDPLRYTPGKGVALYANGSNIPAFLSFDNIFEFDRFQYKSETGYAFRACCNELNPELFGNAIILRQSIFDAGGNAAISVDSGSVITNNVIALRGTNSGTLGMANKFGAMVIAYNTVACTPGVTDSAAFFNGNAQGGGDFGTNPPVVGNLILGCEVPWTYSQQILPPWSNTFNFGNATDVASVAGAGGTHGTATGTATFSDTTANAFTSGMVNFPLVVNGNTFYRICTFTDASHVELRPGGNQDATTDCAGPAQPITLSGASWFVGTPSLTLAFNGQVVERAQLVGLTGITAANQLVDPVPGPTFDARIKNTSADVYGAGADFYFNGATSTPYGGPATPGYDVLNVLRPILGRFDVGAKMFGSAPASPGLGGGRGFFR